MLINFFLIVGSIYFILSIISNVVSIPLTISAMKMQKKFTSPLVDKLMDEQKEFTSPLVDKLMDEQKEFTAFTPPIKYTFKIIQRSTGNDFGIYNEDLKQVLNYFQHNISMDDAFAFDLVIYRSELKYAVINLHDYYLNSEGVKND